MEYAIEEEVKGNALLEENEDNSDFDEYNDDEEANNQLMTWRSNLVTLNQDMVYIELFSGTPVSIDVSIFKQTRTQNDAKKNNAAIVDLLSNLGL